MWRIFKTTAVAMATQHPMHKMLSIGCWGPSRGTQGPKIGGGRSFLGRSRKAGGVRGKRVGATLPMGAFFDVPPRTKDDVQPPQRQRHHQGQKRVACTSCALRSHDWCSSRARTRHFHSRGKHPLDEGPRPAGQAPSHPGGGCAFCGVRPSKRHPPKF